MLAALRRLGSRPVGSARRAQRPTRAAGVALASGCCAGSPPARPL